MPTLQFELLVEGEVHWLSPDRTYGVGPPAGSNVAAPAGST
jgi:hypothetical protein